MIAQIGLTVLLLWVIAYALGEHRRAPLIGTMAVFVAAAGLYFVWLPAHASWLAAFAGIGRGVDLILYIWLVISLIMFLDLHLKLRHHRTRARDSDHQWTSAEITSRGMTRSSMSMRTPDLRA